MLLDDEVAIICENNKFATEEFADGNVFCPTGSHILVSEAIYGRINGGNQCAPNNNTCELSYDVTEEAKSACDNKNACSFKGGNKMYGDPCKGVHKYTRLQFFCQSDDPAVGTVQVMFKEASVLMNKALGIETYNLNWRTNVRENLAITAEKLIADFIIRRDMYNCDPNQEIIEAPADEEDKLNNLPENCREIASPFQRLSVEQRNWRNTFNRCGDGPTRDGFNQRMKKKMRKLRTRAYKRLGCVFD